MSSVERGRWKFVSSASTARKRVPGRMKRSRLAVAAAPPGRPRRPRSRARAPSSCRPRPPGRPAARAASTASARRRRTARSRSGGSAWSSIRRRLTGRNVPAPTCSVSCVHLDAARAQPRRAARGVKCSPAVGAATEPGAPRVDRLVALAVLAARRGVARDVRRQRRQAVLAQQVGDRAAERSTTRTSRVGADDRSRARPADRRSTPGRHRRPGRVSARQRARRRRRGTAARPRARRRGQHARRNHSRVVHDEAVARLQEVGSSVTRGSSAAVRAIDHQQARVLARRRRRLGDQLGGRA